MNKNDIVDADQKAKATASGLHKAWYGNHTDESEMDTPSENFKIGDSEQEEASLHVLPPAADDFNVFMELEAKAEDDFIAKKEGTVGAVSKLGDKSMDSSKFIRGLGITRAWDCELTYVRLMELDSSQPIRRDIWNRDGR